MIVARSIAFNIAFYINMIVWLICALPFLALPRRYMMNTIRGWARSNLWLLRTIAHVDVEFRHRERIPPGGALIAAKHQSIWETFALFLIFSDPVFVLKRELVLIPFFGWYARKAGCVAVNRETAATATMHALYRAAREATDAGRQLLIFPEGTRRPPGAPPAYKKGIVLLYQKLGVPCIPVALNSGLFWPRRQFIKTPGTIVVDVLDPIPAGVPKAEFFETLQGRVETVSLQLNEEARGKDNMPGVVSPRPS